MEACRTNVYDQVAIIVRTFDSTQVEEAAYRH